VVIRAVTVALVLLAAAGISAAAEDGPRPEERLRALSEKLRQCRDDACRVRVQAKLTDLIERLGREAQARGASPMPESMKLPAAGAIPPDAETWTFEVGGVWTATAQGQLVRGRADARLTLRADAHGVFTGTGTVQVETSIPSQPGCSVGPMSGSGAVEVGGLRDGEFVWLWIVPGAGIRTTGRMTCTVQGVTIASDAEAWVAPERELMLAAPVLLPRREGGELVSHGNARGPVGTGPSIGVGDWRRVLRLSSGRHVRALPPPTEDPKKEPSRSWLLEYHLAHGGSEQRGEVAFVTPAGGGPVRAIGSLFSEGHGAASRGRLILDGEVADGRLGFVPRATLEDTAGRGVEQHNLAAAFFNVLFHSRDQRVVLPLRDGVTLQQGPATWRLHAYTPCRLVITAPKPGQRFRFGSGSPGQLDLRLAAEVRPAGFADRIVWSLPTFGVGRVEVEPANLTGPILKVRLEGMPKLNRDFGPKTIEARVQAPGGCADTARTQLKVFFTRDATNNPSGTEPNWFYYWSQTSARTGPRPRYGGRQGKCAGPSGRSDPDTLAYYGLSSRYQPQATTYVICDLTRAGASMPHDDTTWTIQRIVHDGNPAVSITPHTRRLTGIDTFGLASLHENEHMSHLRRWWLPVQNNTVFQREQDGDRDHVPDKEEREANVRYGGPVFIVGQLASNNGIDDEEFYTQLAHDRWVVGSADAEDWAYPGKQWPK